MSFDSNNLETLAANYETERSALDPGGEVQDAILDAALRVGQELSIALAADLEAAVAYIEGL